MFNATWGILGQHEKPCGTCSRSEVDRDGHWHAIDQIIMTARLVSVSNHSIEVVMTYARVG